MFLLLRIFLVITLLYHILVTTIGYGVFGGMYPQIPALLRDGLWLFVLGIYTLTHIRNIIPYLKQWKQIWISFALLVIFSAVISYIKDKSIADMFIGFKYGFQYLFILLSASWLGFVVSRSPSLQAKQGTSGSVSRFLEWTVWILVITVFVGILWQGAKLIWPELFLHIGYGPLNDFHFGAKPPLYYLTGLGGTLRLQGIFAGPNNYGYLLVAFLPLVLSYFRFEYHRWKELFTKKKNLISLIVLFFWLISLVCTLSRTALIGAAVVLILWNLNRLRKHWKWGVGLVGVFLIGIVGLSVLKGSSTIAHITAKFSSLHYVWEKPLGYGLGSSGPAIHHNGTILPENYFVQLMIDIGTFGFLLWIVVAWYLQKIVKKRQDNSIMFHDYSLIRAFWIGWIALLVMGMFLHVFEDSMINYSFFVVWGLILGYAQQKKA